MNEAVGLAIAWFEGVAAMASALGVSQQAVYFWRNGRRSIPVQVCVKIEQITAGAVTRQMLRPDDWAEIWPELAGAAVHGDADAA